MRAAIESGEFETVMLAYNPLDPEGVEREGVLRLAKERGVGVIAMKPLSGGQLVTPEGDYRGEAREDPLVRLSLKYVPFNPHVDVVISGIKRAHEIEEDARVTDEPLLITEEEGQLFSLIASLGLEGLGTLGRCRSASSAGTARVCSRASPCRRSSGRMGSTPTTLRSYGVKVYESLWVELDACIECERRVRSA